ncbi:LOW QUALITY PROTEIN: coiled-coil domain-containing protein 113 [Nylanderia fulva]|uniref:LOW QUALITY PROTEIN: coiled-coil domain-containing protein 113 n=1 Tax=Nylanderia fulva TaxID=613905 RepID=UPI0010FAEFFC|nr:LOW QUALITY PROTEIN: coiled-coil domain-containing protein 113 [Nylanderia fulva]
MTETELQQTLENIVETNLLLKLENDIFERYLARRDPENLQTIAQILETAKRVQKIAPQHGRTSPVASTRKSHECSRRRRGKCRQHPIRKSARHAKSPNNQSAKRSGKVSPPSYCYTSLISYNISLQLCRITYAYRIEMVNTEIRELQKELAKLERTSTKRKVYMRAQMEEAEMSIRETCKTKKEFEENVVKKGVDSITGKIPAEKFIRFIEEWLKIIDAAMEQIRLRMTTTRSQIRKVKLQLQHRKELGEALRAVDFEQLNIENQVCIREIDEKNRYLLEMKRIVAGYNIALTKHKEKVGNLMSIINEVRNKIASKKQEIVKLQLEKVAMKVEIKKAEEQLKSVMALMDDFEVPDVIDFIKKRIEFQELRRIHKQLSRQRNIQQISLKSNK